MIINQAQLYKEQVIILLESEKLPVIDLPENLANFLVAIHDKEIVGVIGVEVYGCYGLLRSLVVQPKYRSLGIAGKLIEQIEALSESKGVTTLYLLTETAQEYFKRKGFANLERNETPVEVQQSAEFSHVCPVSATVMKKELKQTI